MNITPYNNDLVHSALNPYGDSLRHAKYLDKFFKNGKWRYVYEKAKNGVKKAPDSIAKKLNNSYHDGRAYQAQGRSARKHLATAAADERLAKYDNRGYKPRDNKFDERAIARFNRLYKQANVSGSNRRYKNTNAYTVDQAIKKAKKAVSSTASDAVSKAKKSVSSVENKLGRYVGERKVKNILSGNGKKAAKAAKSMLDASKSKTGSTKTVNKEARASNSSSKLSNKPSSTNSVNKKKKSFNSLNGKPKKKSFKSTRRT